MFLLFAIALLSTLSNADGKSGASSLIFGKDDASGRKRSSGNSDASYDSGASFKHWIGHLDRLNQKVTVHLMSGTALVGYDIKSVSDTYIMVLGPETEADEMKQMVFIHAIERIEPMEGHTTTPTTRRPR